MKQILAQVMLLSLCLAASSAAKDKEVDKAPRLFEMRVYYAMPGKMNALHQRFNDHTCKLFKKHGMTLVGFWSPTDQKGAKEKMIYILAHASKEAADKSWKAFRADKEWIKARDASEKDGKLVKNIDIVWMKATDYSPIK